MPPVRLRDAQLDSIVARASSSRRNSKALRNSILWAAQLQPTSVGMRALPPDVHVRPAQNTFSVR
jgi:hypothetical protein